MIRHLRARGALITLLALAPFAAPVLAQPGEGEMPPMGKPAEMDQIAFMLGEWNVSMEMRMGPEAPFTSHTGEASVTSVLDGCVQRMDFSAQIMGMPMKGIDHTTFNRNTQQFESIWVDNLGANFTSMHGGMEEGRFALSGQNKMMGEDVWMRSSCEKRSDDELYWSMDESTDGGKTWTTTMKMTYTRK